MGKSATVKRIKDFVIVGPRLTRDNKVLDAIHSLYYLPENYKLVFTGAAPKDDALYQEVMALIQRDALADRVHFAHAVGASDAVIVPPSSRNTGKRDVFGDSPEALASAILKMARVTTV